MTEDELIEMIDGLPDDMIVEVPARFLRELIGFSKRLREVVPQVQMLQDLVLRMDRGGRAQ